MQSAENPFSGRHVMVVAAHPDDETIGAGVALADAARLTLVHVTDGAEYLFRALIKGHASRAAYAQARREELQRAYFALPMTKNFLTLAIHDQRAAYQIGGIARSLRDLFVAHKPDVIATHCFEGGHPDHDATAMAVHLAARSSDNHIPLYEMSGYNRAGGKDAFGIFLPRTDSNEIRLPLSQDARARKNAMLAAFASQTNTISKFPLDAECVRPAPNYSFTDRPHPGPLFYETHLLSMTWSLWLKLAERGVREFESENNTTHAADWRSRYASLTSNLWTAVGGASR